MRCELGKAIAGYEMIFRRQLTGGDLKGARATLDRLVSLLGLSAPKSYVITTEMLDEEIARLEARARRARGADAVRAEGSRPRPGALRGRLGALRDKACWLKLHAELGRDLRLALESAGAPAWRPAEDLSFRTWIEAHGGEVARQMLIALDEALDAEYAELQAREEQEHEADADSPAPPT